MTARVKFITCVFSLLSSLSSDSRKIDPDLVFIVVIIFWGKKKKKEKKFISPFTFIFIISKNYSNFLYEFGKDWRKGRNGRFVAVRVREERKKPKRDRASIKISQLAYLIWELVIWRAGFGGQVPARFSWWRLQLTGVRAVHVSRSRGQLESRTAGLFFGGSTCVHARALWSAISAALVKSSTNIRRILSQRSLEEIPSWFFPPHRSGLHNTILFRKKVS